MSDSNEGQARTWNMMCHLAALAGFIGIPLGNVLGPLVVWLIKKNEMPSVDTHAKESMNFQISMLLYSIIAGVLALVLIGFVLLVLLIIVDLVFIILASIKASNGEEYRYPMTLRFIK